MSDYQSRNIDTGSTDTTGSTQNTGSQGMDLSGMQQRVQDMAGQAMDTVNEKLGVLREQATQATQNLTETVRTGMDRVRTMDRNDLNVLYDDVLENARSYPGRTILISAGVGLVLGMMLRGSNRNL